MKKKKRHEVVIEAYPCKCPYCNQQITIRFVTIEEIGQKILMPCCHCKRSIRIRIVGPLLSNFVIEKYDSRENIRIEK